MAGCHREPTRPAAPGAIRTPVSERLALDDVPAGLAGLAAGENLGRLVVML